MSTDFGYAPAPPSPPPEAPIHTHKVRNRILIGAGVIIAVFIGAAIGASGAKGTSASSSTSAPVTVTAAAPPAVTVTAGAPAAVTVTAEAPPAVTVTAAAPAPVTVVETAVATVTAPAPVATTDIPDGISLVGTDIQPGTYKSTSPDCYFARLSDTSGGFSGIITNGNGATIVTIDPTDKAFESRRCAPWIQVG